MIRGHSLNPKDFDKYINCGIYVLRELEDNSVEQVADSDIKVIGLINLIYDAFVRDVTVNGNKIIKEDSFDELFNMIFCCNGCIETCRHNTIIVPYMYYEGPTKNGDVARWKCSTLKLRKALQDGLIFGHIDHVTSDSCKDWIIDAIKHLYYGHREVHNIGDMGFTEFCLNLCCGYNQLFENPRFIRKINRGCISSYEYLEDSDIAMLNSIDMKNDLKG